jgi:hypothetical protein
MAAASILKFDVSKNRILELKSATGPPEPQKSILEYNCHHAVVVLNSVGFPLEILAAGNQGFLRAF